MCGVPEGCMPEKTRSRCCLLPRGAGRAAGLVAPGRAFVGALMAAQTPLNTQLRCLLTSQSGGLRCNTTLHTKSLSSDGDERLYKRLRGTTHNSSHAVLVATRLLGKHRTRRVCAFADRCSASLTGGSRQALQAM